FDEDVEVERVVAAPVARGLVGEEVVVGRNLDRVRAAGGVLVGERGGLAFKIPEAEVGGGLVVLEGLHLLRVGGGGEDQQQQGGEAEVHAGIYRSLGPP